LTYERALASGIGLTVRLAGGDPSA
jgi:hypothetical protein